MNTINKIRICIFIILFYFTNAINTSAQLIETIFPVPVGDNFEDFYFDPHYDDKGEIKYYTLGNLLCFKIKYNKQGLPERKTLYQLNKDNCKWITAYETSLFYKDSLLTGEISRTFGWGSLFYRGSIMNLTTRKVYTYDNVNSSQTISIYTYNLLDDRADTLSQINYADKNARIDSSHLYRIDEGRKELVKRVVNSYDEQGRLTSIKLHNYSTTPPISLDLLLTENEWEHFLEYKTVEVRDKNGKFEEYILKENDEIEDDDDENIRIEMETFISYEKDQTTYTMYVNGKLTDGRDIRTKNWTSVINRDSKGRISGQKSIFGKDLVKQSSQISYDKKGRTVVNREWVLGRIFYEHIPDARDFVGYTTTYSPSGIEETEFYTKDEEKQENKKINLAKFTTSYNSSDEIASMTTTIYDPDEGIIRKKRKIDKIFNSEDQLIEAKAYEIDIKDNKQKQVSGEIHEYDDNGNRILSETYDINDKGIKLYKSKTISKYNNPDLLANVESFRWNKAINQWETQSKILFEYNSDGRMTSRKLFLKDKNGELKAISYLETTYSPDGSIASRTSYKWRNGKWENSEMDRDD